MKRRDVIAKIGEAASASGLSWGMTRQGAKHELWSLDGEKVTIPRHRDINERTAHGIFRSCEEKLGEGWWRN